MLYYVDTFTATAYRWSYDCNKIRSYKIEERNSIAVIIPILGKITEFVVGADRYLYKLIWYSDDQNKAELQKLLMVEEKKPFNQFNDGKVDNKGRLWIGTLTRNPDLSVKVNGGSLYMIKGSNPISFQEKVPSLSISNGLAWSTDNKNFYHIDSQTRKIFAYKYDEDSGNLGAKSILFDLGTHPELEGIPDGMTIDSTGSLWIALFGGHSIINIDSETGALKRVIEIPATYVTSACFGGPELDILYVTTSKLHLNETDIGKEPLAGSVFAVNSLGVKGVPSKKFLIN